MELSFNVTRHTSAFLLQQLQKKKPSCTVLFTAFIQVEEAAVSDLLMVFISTVWCTELKIGVNNFFFNFVVQKMFEKEHSF